MKRNLLLTIQFDGTAYHGWQVQKNAITVQETLQDAFEQICRTRDNVIGCSRTDSGVHANMYCCNIRTESMIECHKLVTAMNAVLPPDISVTDCREVDYGFHSRYDCVSKEYIYRIWNSSEKNPFLYKYSLEWKYPIDAEFLDRCSKCFIGTFDYKGFCSSGSSVEDTVRTVKNASVVRNGDMVIFKVEANGFLYNMVRIMVGTLLDISAGKIRADDLKSVIESGIRENAGFTAPARGLFLNYVKYEQDG